jgi:hypothetical protein
MKVFILSPDGQGRIDGTNKHQLLDRLPGLVMSERDADVVLVPISFYPDYTFSRDLVKIRKPVVIVDYMEYGWDFWRNGNATHLFGDGRLPDNLRANREWQWLDECLSERDISVYFKRELLLDDAAPVRVKPIEFVCTGDIPPVQDKASFDARSFDVVNIWGYSHPDRARFHGEIFQAMGTRGINVISDWSQLTPNMPRQKGTWLSIYSPYWVRQPLSRVIELQREARVSVSLPGCGQKCFRSAESPRECIMALHGDRLAWSYPWHTGNSIQLGVGTEFLDIHFALQSPDLYDTYVAGQENMRRYQVNNYIRDYVVPSIAAAL